MRARGLGAAALVLALLGAGLWLRAHPRPTPTRPADFEALDPLLRQRLDAELVAVGRRPRSAEAWLCLGMLEEANGLFGDAARCYAEALGLAPEDAKILHRLACTEERLGNLEQAAETMARAARADPTVAATWWRLAGWRLDLGELEPAAEALARARALLPEEPALRLGAVRLALAQGNPAEARARLEGEDLLAGPFASQAQHLLALALRQLGDLDGAERAAAQADGRAPSFPDPWALELASLETGYAALRLRAGRDVQARRFAAAEPKLRAILEHERDDARSLNLLAVCRLEQGDAAEALGLLQQALALEPDFHEAALNHARALLGLGTRESAPLAAAFERVERATAARSEDAGAWRLRAALAKALAHREEALAALERAAELEPEATDVRLQAGYTELELERFEAALARFRALQVAHPALTEACFGEATVLVRAQRFEEARAVLEPLARRPDADAQRLAKLRAALQAPR